MMPMIDTRTPSARNEQIPEFGTNRHSYSVAANAAPNQNVRCLAPLQDVAGQYLRYYVSMNRTVVRNFEPRVERRSDGQRGEHCDGVADHARNDQALCGGVSVRELGMYFSAQFGHFASKLSAERVHVGSGDELGCRRCGEQFHEVIRLFGSDGVFESVEDVASVFSVMAQFGDSANCLRLGLRCCVHTNTHSS